MNALMIMEVVITFASTQKVHFIVNVSLDTSSERTENHVLVSLLLFPKLSSQNNEIMHVLGLLFGHLLPLYRYTFIYISS